jgi:2-polyprenyl-3-methyl-5-hydroxy-6-metoxy-1,4-benzoquinol methylase
MSVDLIMETSRSIETGIVDFPLSFLKRTRCPGCFSGTEKAVLTMQSMPSAEHLPLNKHGKFLSGYTNERVFFSYYRCDKCQLLYCPTYFTQEQLNTLYKNQSENMAEAPLQARVRTQKAYYDLINKYPLPAGDYLEIGADIGLFAKFFIHEAQIDNLFLYEPNYEVHDALKKNVENKKHQIRIKNYEVSDIARNSLSIAVIIHALDHLLEPRHLVRDIYQNLKPGGIIFIVTHDESSLLSRLLKKKWPPYTLQHPQLFRPATIQNLLEAEGFTILQSEKTVNYFPLMYFVKGGLTALGLSKVPIPSFAKPIVPIKLGNIATIAQKPFGNTK